MAKKSAAGDVTEGGSKRRPGGVGFSGPSPDRAELAERGAKKRTLYLSPERAAQFERLRLALELPEEGALAAIWARAADDLEKKLAAEKG